MKLFKTIVFLALFASFSLTFVAPTFADELPKQVRVGLTEKSKSQNVPISNKYFYLGWLKDGVFQSQEDLFTGTNFCFYANDKAYLSNGVTYRDYNQAQTNLAEMGYVGVVVYKNVGEWTIYVEAAKAPQNMGLSVVANTSNKLYSLFDGERELIVFDCGVNNPAFIDANDGFMDLQGAKYRGAIEISRSKSSALQVVNVVNIEDYLLSVVPSEIPSAWHIEAQKAQAVAARSYTYTRMGVHKDAGFDVCDVSHCQIYLGTKNESAQTSDAVMQTSGVIAYYDQKPINATFFSSSGGATESSENVWANAIPYLRSVKEISETGAKQWTLTLTLDNFKTLLDQNGVNIGNVTGVSLANDATSGRVTSMTISGTNGQKVYSKDTVRQFFNGGKFGNLDSTNFAIANAILTGQTTAQTAQQTPIKATISSNNSTSDVFVSDLFVLSANGQVTRLENTVVATSTQVLALATNPTNNVVTTSVSSGNVVTFVGKGWGHGVGLSQFGAKGMAETGYTFTEILKHYYTGIEVY